MEVFRMRSSRNRASIVVALLALAIVVLGTGPAGAAAPVTITSPADGVAHAPGYTGPVSVDFSGGDMGTYAIAVTGPHGYGWNTTWNFDGSQTTSSWAFPQTRLAGTYTVTVTAPDETVAATATFLINPAVMASSAAPTPFYPLEQDGFRDALRFTFRTNATAADTVRVVNSRGRAIRIAKVGALSGTASHSWAWHGRKNNGARVQPGVFRLHLVAVTDERKLRGPVVVVRVRALAPRINGSSVAPSPFYPIERDGYRDTTTFRFSTNVRASDTIRVRGPGGRIVRIARLGVLKGHAHPHTWTWNGTNNGGEVLAPGTYRVKVVSVYYGQKVVSAWRKVVLKRKPGGGGGGGGGGANCTPGYSPCLTYHGGADYDCAGGSGNGPYYTTPGVVYRVTGSDPYGLDADNDGYGCE
jgi:flagellar hook assembly protein FlgD